MSETKYIAEMAAKVADELFSVFKWKRKVVEDHSWECVTSEAHGNKKDHPSDCVFYYRDPYDNEMKYINTDLKSFAKTSIKSSKIREAVRSLSYATDCAAYNPNWKSKFKPEEPHTVQGMLFVYNHCGNYQGDFNSFIKNINKNDKDTPKANLLDGTAQIFVMSPEMIVHLNSIVKDIKVMIGEELLPKSDSFCFFHPNEILNKNHFDKEYSEPATLEILFSPWIILKHAASSKSEAGYIIYYMKDGDEVDEFVYLLDALSYYQILNDKGSVRIKLVRKNQHGALNLHTAIDKYYSLLGYSDERIKEIQDTLKGETIDRVVPQFSSMELGVNE